MPRLRLTLNGEILGERLPGDDHGRRVDPVLATETLKTPGHVHHGPYVVVIAVHVPQVGSHLEAVGVLLVLVQAGGQWGVASHDERWHGLGDTVA